MTEQTKETRWSELWALLSANALSMVGNSLSAIAIPWFVYELTGSGTITATVLLAGQLPNLLVGLFGGVLIDRFGAKPLSLLTDAVNFIAVLLIPALFTVGALDAALLALLVFLSQLVDIPGYTARSVIVPELIDRHGLPRERVNGMVSMVETGADLAGPIIAASLLSLIGALYLLVIDAFTFLASMLIILWGVKSVRSAPSGSVSLHDSLKWLLSDRVVIKLCLFDIVVNLVATSLLVLALPVLAKTLEAPFWLGIWLACFAAGTTLTTVAYTFIGHKLSALTLLRVTPIGQGIGLAVVALVTVWQWPLWLIAGGLFLYGVNLGVGSMIDAIVLQKRVPAEQRGSIFAVFQSVRYLGVPVGLLLTGWGIDTGAFTLLFVAGAAICISASAIFFAHRTAL